MVSQVIGFSLSEGLDKGIRYPYTFLFYVRNCWLGKFLERVLRDKLLGITVANSGVRIPFLTFADDTMILQNLMTKDVLLFGIF